jgi:glycosyltransferase involved in cell wall biosynthesis
MRRRVILDWGISSFFGWGVYGLNLALNWADDAAIEPLCAMPLRPEAIAVDPLKRLALAPFMQRSADLQAQMSRHAGGAAEADAPVMVALGNDFAIPPAAHQVRLTGRPTIGTVFFETAQLSAEVVKRARRFPLIVTGSTWNTRILAEYGITNVKTVLQGIDPGLFHPAPATRSLGGRFLVFSGGKLELRKGQDLVLAAFARFAAGHPEALLVTAWHSPWPQMAASVNASGIAAPVTFGADGKVDVTAWAEASGVDPAQLLDLGAVPNAFMPSILREMDVALFPNRAEGGTNLVAMECMACAIPTILSANTGHLDLIDDDTCYPLTHQRPLGGAGAGIGETPGWGESDIDEIVERLEQVFTDRTAARRIGTRGADRLAGLSWARTAADLKLHVLDLH